MVLAMECVILCVLFTIMVLATSKKSNGYAMLNDYPPEVGRRVRKMGLLTEGNIPTRKRDMKRKLLAVILYSLLFSLLLYFANGCRSFWEGAFYSYLIWLAVDWYDFLVVDIAFAPFDKLMKKVNYKTDFEAVKFHFMGSVKGMVIGIPFALVVGLLVLLLNQIF